ncbi:MAG TPA: metallophosphoesterase [Dissulfurispiraceae bacterium]|nr:metallophosphoesterase [Dissulfurispiraceae bacterium]
MSLFLIAFFLIYGSMHLYVFVRAKRAIGFSRWAGIAVALVMAVMILTPLLIRLCERAGFETLPRIMAYVGYTWTGIIFLLVCTLLLTDLCRVILSLAGKVNWTRQSGWTFYLPLVISLTASLYGYFEALNIRNDHITIASPKIPREHGRIRVVQISDVHLGLIVREERLQRILKVVRKAEPDMLVATGDIVDGQMDGLDGLSNLLADLRPRYGKYAITGNHEFYAGLDQAVTFIGKAGFTMLRDDLVTVDSLITIAGVDDPAGKSFPGYSGVPEKTVLSRAPDGMFVLLLKHRPLVDADSAGLFDLQLSGHVHKGQIFPFSLLTRVYYPNYAGLLRLNEGSFLYVNRGTGTWGPPIRLFAPPEVTVIDLVHGESS